MDAAVFGVGIYNREKNSLDFPATKEKGAMLPSYSFSLDEESQLAVWCFKNRKEVVIGDFEKEHQKYVREYNKPVEEGDPASYIYIPLIQQKKVIGVVTTQSFEKNAYTGYHINLLRNLATYAAIALDNASAYRQLNAILSELKNTQNQLVQQAKLASLGQLTAGIAHEIKNPLNFVNNFSEVSVELIKEVRGEILSKKKKVRGEKSPFERGNAGEAGEDHTISENNGNPKIILSILDDIEANLCKIQEHGSRADGILKSMLQHSRTGSGNLEPTLINPLIKEYAKLAFHGMRAGKDSINVDIQLDLDEKLGKVNLISEDFSRVVLNLANNAFDAMREKAKTDPGYKPVLSISTKQKEKAAEIAIADNGPGIPDDIKEKILQPFFTTKKGTQGTGLGLSITNDIVKAHGGSLQVESNDGEGTAFTIILPVSR